MPLPLHLRPLLSRSLIVRVLVAASAAGLTACTHLPADVERALPADVLLLGEQHDAPAHQRLHHDTVRALAARGQLAALALEMADQGASTQGLTPGVDEAAVRHALGWNEAAWPWTAYGPTVMAAVRAGVPVLGANLPRAQMRAAMADSGLDARLTADALARQRSAIRAGHCDLLPEAQIAPMARIQIGRDRAMADTVSGAALAAAPAQKSGNTAGPGMLQRTVVLIAGNAHVDAELGVPRHLPPGLRVQAIVWPKAPPAKDYCAELRQQLSPRPAPVSP